MMSLPAWGVWIEIGLIGKAKESLSMSLPAWGVWIEIGKKIRGRKHRNVAPRMGSVD